MKKFLRYILFISMSFGFLPVALGSLRDLGSPFVIIADFLEGYNQAIWIIAAFFGGTSGLLLAILQLKEQQAALVVRKAAARDDFWDHSQIENHCRYVFYSLFDAISSGDLTSIEPLVTPKYFREITSFSPEPTISQNDIVNPIDVIDTKIVATSDCIENDLDEVKLCLTGNFIRPANGTGFNAKSFAVEKMPFQILCTFTRNGQEWKLNKLDDHVSLMDLLIRSNSKYEC